MKQYLIVWGLALALSGIFASCKTASLDSLRADEVAALDKYVKDNNLADAKDDSGIYFKSLELSGDTTYIRSGFKAMIFYNITLINGSVVFSTQDGSGHDYEEQPFYVDVNNDVVNASYVQQIAGLHHGLKKMHVGDKAFMVIPSELAFKALDYSSIGIPRFSTLLATIKIVRAYSPAELDALQQ